MSKYKYYAVRKGRKTGIFNTLEECQEQVYKYKGAEYRGFNTLDEAELYIAAQYGFSFYTDGSFNAMTDEYGYGVCYLLNGKLVSIYSRKGNDRNFAKTKNVAGELSSAMLAILIAEKLDIPKITIYHDFIGVSNFANGIWKTKNRLFKGYIDLVKEERAKGMEISFVHVKGHSGNQWNDLADILARYKLGMTSYKEKSFIRNISKRVEAYL